MLPARRQSLQIYDEYIKWWASANNFQCWKLLASAHHLIKPHFSILIPIPKCCVNFTNDIFFISTECSNVVILRISQLNQPFGPILWTWYEWLRSQWLLCLFFFSSFYIFAKVKSLSNVSKYVVWQNRVNSRAVHAFQKTQSFQWFLKVHRRQFFWPRCPWGLSVRHSVKGVLQT